MHPNCQNCRDMKEALLSGDKLINSDKGGFAQIGSYYYLKGGIIMFYAKGYSDHESYDFATNNIDALIKRSCERKLSYPTPNPFPASSFKLTLTMTEV